MVSARQIKELMEVTLPGITKNLGPAERAAILASQNYALYQQALDGLKLVKEVIDTQLSKRLTPDQISKVKESLVDIPLSHSIKVTSGDLEKLGFDVMTLKATGDLGLTLIEYHRGALKNLIAEVPGGQGIVLFESQKASFQIIGQVIQQFPAPRPAPPSQPRSAPPPGSEQPPGGGQPPTSSPG